MKEITYIDSTEVTRLSQLKEIFRDKCSIMINGRIYTSIDSIIEINEILSALRHWEYEHYADPEGFIAETNEFKRIANMATNLKNNN